ncbi:MAG: hypothetical protein ABEJ58_10925 [Halodesulfurarchaeum sp.]
MSDGRTGGYHEWTAFLRCPSCGRGDVALEHYSDGTLIRCKHCGAEAWAAGVSVTETSANG